MALFTKKQELVHTIRKEDVGKGFIKANYCVQCHRYSNIITVRDFMGNVQFRDIGKRIFSVLNDVEDDHFYAVENDEQLAKRLKR